MKLTNLINNEKRIADLKEQFLNKEVYSETYKEGVITDILGSTQVYLKVKFKTDEKSFAYPSCFDNEFLILGKPKSFEEMNYHEREVTKEKDKFYEIINICKDHIQNDIIEEDDSMSYEEYDLDFEDYEKLNNFKNISIREQHADSYKKIIKEPFFGSFISDKDGLIYVAKNELKGETLKWTDPICSTYYNYTYLSSDPSIGLKLVRDHHIIDNRYKNFVDKFNILNDENQESYGFNLETTIDKNLVMVIENERKSKKTHEIIATIQSTQYEIISDTKSENIVVSGVAGSGKTMVLFHRLAYLAFNEEGYIPLRHLVLSASKLLNREANVLANELDIEQIYNLDIRTFYSNLVKQYINCTKSTYVFDTTIDNLSINYSLYNPKILGEIKSNAINLAKNRIDNREYKKFRFRNILNKIKHIYPNFIERDFDEEDFLNSYFLIDNDSLFQQNLVKEILKKMRLYNLDYMYEANLLSENQKLIYVFIRDYLNGYLNQHPLYDFESPDFKSFIDYYKSLDNQANMVSNKVLLDTFTGKNVVSYDIVVYASDYMIIKTFLREISFYIATVLFDDNIKDLNKEELDSYKFIRSAFIDYKDYFEQFDRHSDLKIALFSLKNKVNVTGYANCTTKNIMMAKGYAVYIDYLANKEECDRFIELGRKVNFDMLEEYHLKNNLKFFQQLKDLFGSNFTAKPAYFVDFTALNALEDAIKNDKIIESCFVDKACYSTLVHIYDRRIFNHNFIKEIGYLKKTIIQIVKENRNFKYNPEAGEFLVTYLGEFLDKNSYGDNPLKYLNSDQTLNCESPELDAFVQLVNLEDKKESCYIKGLKSVAGLVDLFDYSKLKKDVFQYTKYKENNNFDEIFYILEFLLKDYKLNVQDKAFVYAYTLKDFYETKYNFTRIFIDEFQNYSVEEIKLLKTIFKNAKLELYGDYKQKIEEKGINSLKEIDFFSVKQYELKVNYRNSFEICQFLNKKFHMNMLGVGIKGSVTVSDIHEPIGISHSDDRTVLIVKNLDELKNLKFVPGTRTKLINPNIDYIERNLINIIKVEDVKGLEFEKVYVVEHLMNENESYIACTRALNDLVLIK